MKLHIGAVGAIRKQYHVTKTPRAVAYRGCISVALQVYRGSKNPPAIHPKVMLQCCSCREHAHRLQA